VLVYVFGGTGGEGLGAVAGWQVFYAWTRDVTENTDGDWAGLEALVIGSPVGALVGMAFGLGLVFATLSYRK
jgi:hypothetical protein